MSDHDAYDESLAFRDAQTAHEARFLMRGLRQMAIDPQAEVPTDFHATVMARAQTLPIPHKPLWEQLSVRLTLWVPVLAVGLMLSLGAHVWQGIRALRPSAPGAQHRTAQLPGTPGATEPVSIYQFQAQLSHAEALGSLVAARPAPQTPRAMIGFTPHTARSTFVRIGVLYADTLAALHSGTVEVAEDRLRLLTQAVTSLQAPPALARYLQEMQAMLQRQAPADHTVAQFMALFEPLYAQIYATDPTAAERVLFQAGAWVENLAFAAAVGDQRALQQAPVGQALHDALLPLGVPAAALNALEQLRVLVARQPMTAEDLGAIQTLVDTIKQHLSA